MATTEQFSLRWNNFHSNLTTGFHELLQAAEMVDVTLAVDGHFLQAHKVVLSICSPYFRHMFKVNPCKHPIVILKDVSHENIKDILQFMYQGEVSVLRDNLSSFLRTAELLQVKGLTGDDSSDESPPRKDDKLDVDTNDEENEIYNQLIETTDVELPQYPPTAAQSASISQPLKRSCKPSCSNTNGKRAKSETSPINQTKPVKPECVKNEVVKAKMDVKDYNNCDYTTGVGITDTYNANVNNVERCGSEGEESKEIGKLGGGINLWENNLASMSATALDASDQDAGLFATDNRGHVFCPYCCRKFVNRYNLKVHVRDKHEANSTDLDCQICGKTMRNPSCLRVHMYHHRKQQTEVTTASVV